MGRPLRALIVEDSEDDTALLVKELKRGGYNPVFERVETARALSDALDHKPWDIVLSDYTIPNFSGTAALKLLKSKGMDIPFIFVSGTLGEDVAVAAMKAGASDYIVKGNLKRMAPAIERELREAEARRRHRAVKKERDRVLEREQEARAEIEKAQQRLTFLARASTLLASSLDYSRTLSNVARLAVPYLADWCVVDVIEDDEPFRQDAVPLPVRQAGGRRGQVVAAADPEKEQLVRWLMERYPEQGEGHPLRKALRTGKPQFIPEVTEPFLAAMAHDEKHLNILRELELKSAMIVSLLARGRTLGAITLASSQSNRRYTKEDLALAEDLAHRCALAVDNARLYHVAQEEIGERRRSEAALKARASQQAVVTQLGQLTLSGADLSALLSETAGLVARTLDVPYCGVFELNPEGSAFVLRAGAGWKAEYMGQATAPTDAESQLSYTLARRGPVIVEDLRRESRFSGPDLLREHGIVSGLSVVIEGQDRPFGVLSAHANRPRSFSEDDIQFLQAVTHVLANAVVYKQAEGRIRHLAFYDALTDLPNRRLLLDRLDQAIRTANREGKSAALLILDLDRFKEINDTMGHPAGDLLLRQIGPRLKGALRESDTVARLGGDEFAVLLPNVDTQGGVRTAQKILRSMETPFPVEGVGLDMGISIGIAISSEHGEDPDILMRHADTAMYIAKQDGNGYTVYSPDQDRPMPRRLALTGELRHAIEQGELRLHYLPEADLRTGRLIGVEALVRWQHRDRGLLLPDQFIPLAERSGLIKPLTLWVLETALRDRIHWRSVAPTLRIAVNLSARNLQDAPFPDLVAERMRACGMPPVLLELEIPESALTPDPARRLEGLSRLHKLGVWLSVDDFGTGQSWLGRLKAVPVQEIKIDRSLVKGMMADPSDAVIVRSTIELAHQLGFKVVGEGVEDKETLSRLRLFECDAAQGDHLSRPIPADEMKEWLLRRQLGRGEDRVENET